MIYIDVSDLAFYLGRGLQLSGIQRVTFNCVLGLKRLLPEGQVRVLGYDAKRDALMWADADIISRLADVAPEDRKKQMARGLPCVDGLTWQKADFNRGDTILLTEGFWSEAALRRISADKAHYGLTIYQYIHDVLPIAAREHFFDSTVTQFDRRVTIALKNADVILTNSDYSRQDILKHCGSRISSGVAVHVLKLPHELSWSDQPRGDGSSDDRLPASAMGAKPFVLMVGLLDSRKNALRVSQAWRALARQYGSRLPTLVIVGKFSWVSWHRLKMKALLLSDRLLNKPLVHLHRCDDEQLDLLYRNCLFSVYVSDYEGWGLPIGESMWYGRPVLAGTSTSLPEVGGDLVDYVDPHNDKALQAGLAKLCFDGAHRETRVKALKNAKLRSWDDFNAALRKILLPS